MLTLTDVNRALDRLGVRIFIPRTRRQLAFRVAPGSVHVDRNPERVVVGLPRRPAVVVPLRHLETECALRDAGISGRSGQVAAIPQISHDPLRFVRSRPRPAGACRGFGGLSKPRQDGSALVRGLPAPGRMRRPLHLARRLLMVRPMNGNPLAESGREVALVRGSVVIFRPRVRIAVSAARQPPRLVPGVVVPLDGRRIPRRRPERSSQIQWFVVGSAATVLLLFVVRLFLR